MKPAPGRAMLATSRPITSASVDTSSKYSSALPPTRPTFFMSCMPAMPCTTVQKITGAMIILTSLMKPSPRGFRSTPSLGSKYPSSTPQAMANSTCTYSTL